LPGAGVGPDQRVRGEGRRGRSNRASPRGPWRCGRWPWGHDQKVTPAP